MTARFGAWFALLLSVVFAAWLASAAAACAAPMALADKSRSVVTDDGWVLSVTASQLWANPVPNLATTLTSREGFFSAKVTGEITGVGSSGVRSGVVEQGLQVGCAVDVSSGLQVGMQFSIGPSVGVQVSQSGAGVNAGLNGSVAPSLQTTVLPGQIVTVPLGRKEMAGARASITAWDVHVQVDACAGPVTVRSYAMAAISTDVADDTIYVYSDPTWI